MPDRRRFVKQAAGLLCGIALPGLAGGCAPEDGPSPTPVRARLRFLTDDPGFVASRPCVSPSGAHVLFQRAPAGADPVRTANSNVSPWSLWTVPAEGGEPTLFFGHDRIRATRPVWHGPTDRVAFSGVLEGRGGLWIVDGDGGGLHAVLEGEPPLDQLFYPSWFPGGGFLAVTDYRRHVVLRVEAGSGRVEPLTDPSRVLAGMSSVSPRPRPGAALAFAGQRLSEQYEISENGIWLMGEDGGLTRLDAGQGRMPGWAPSGEALAFMSTRARRQPMALLHRRGVAGGIAGAVVARLPGVGGDPELLAVSPPDHAISFPKWFPDGRSLVCGATDLRTGRSGIARLDLG